MTDPFPMPPIPDHGGRWLFDPATGAMTQLPDEDDATPALPIPLPAAPLPAGPEPVALPDPMPDAGPAPVPLRKSPAKADTVKGA